MGTRFVDGIVWGGGFGVGLAVISAVLSAVFHTSFCGG